jgi:hypothetical protein
MDSADLHVPVAKSPLDQWRGAAPPPKRKSGRKKKAPRQTSVIIHHEPVTLFFE